MPCFTATLVIGVSNWRETRDASLDRLGEGGSQVDRKHEGDPLNIFLRCQRWQSIILYYTKVSLDSDDSFPFLCNVINALVSLVVIFSEP